MTNRPPRGETPTLSSPISARNAPPWSLVAPVLGVEVEEDGVLACVWSRQTFVNLHAIVQMQFSGDNVASMA